MNLERIGEKRKDGDSIWCEERNGEINRDLDGGGKGKQRKGDAMGGEGEQRMVEMKTITMGLSFF